MRLGRSPYLAILTIALLSPIAFADEPPTTPPPGQPAPANPPGKADEGLGPDVPAMPGAAGADGAADPSKEAPDLLAFLATFERTIAKLRIPPDHTPTDHALFDWWNTILSPRIGQMASRIKTISEKHRWVKAPDGRTLHLQPASWDQVVREVAALYTSLDGALQQYKTVRVKYTRPTTLGIVGKEPGPPDPDGPIRALTNLESVESTLTQKVNQGQVIWYDELVWYWNLLRTAELEVARYERELERWERQVQAFEDLQARLAYGLSFQRQTLQIQMFTLRAYVAALQTAEEDRLRTVVAKLPAGSPARTSADGLIFDLRTARNAAENHTGSGASTWGTLLRSKWLAPRKKLLDLLAAVERDAAAAAKAADAAAGGAAPVPQPAPAAPEDAPK